MLCKVGLVEEERSLEFAGLISYVGLDVGKTNTETAETSEKGEKEVEPMDVDATTKFERAHASVSLSILTLVDQVPNKNHLVSCRHHSHET